VQDQLVIGFAPTAPHAARAAVEAAGCVLQQETLDERQPERESR
jgi:hypothetical protein